ncbi:MAG: sugar-binding protein [Anaerolineales bacterium]
MNRTKIHIAWLSLFLAASACTVPGANSPTPFAFPTPNLTLTAIFAPTETASAPTAAPSQPPTATSTSGASSEMTPTPVSGARSNGAIIVASRLSAAPTIDGDLSEWTSDRLSLTEPSYGSDQLQGGNDLSASYTLGWDSTNLYLGIQVNDDAFVQTASGRSLYKGDSLEILLDADLAGDFSSSVLSADDYQVGISPGNLDGRAPEAYRWFPRAVEGSLSTVEAAAKANGSGYVLEAKIPWIVFGIQPAANDSFGFVLSVSDNDQAGSATQQSLVSSVRTRSLTDPKTWGTLILAGSGS